MAASCCVLCRFSVCCVVVRAACSQRRRAGCSVVLGYYWELLL